MFKSVSNLRDRKGFTLIELLIVIAIIGILAAIAVPAFLGQRDKARVGAVEASARTSVSEIQAILDDFVAGTPYMLLSSAGQQTCYQRTGAVGQNLCASRYPTFTGTSVNVATLAAVITTILDHHNGGKQEVSPLTGVALFTTALTSGHVALIINGADLEIVGTDLQGSTIYYNKATSF